VLTGVSGAPGIAVNSLNVQGTVNLQPQTLATSALTGAFVTSGFFNNVTLSGSVTGSPCTLSTTGGDANVGLTITTTGIGPITIADHMVFSGSAPSVVRSANLGSTGTVTVAAGGTDERGVITFTPSGTAIAAGDLFTVTFASAWAAAPVVVFSPLGTNLYVGTNHCDPYVSLVTPVSTTTFTIGAVTAPTTAIVYKIAYHVIG
jgi:hypothetical protein